jgi:hypothetical protein
MLQDVLCEQPLNNIYDILVSKFESLERYKRTPLVEEGGEYFTRGNFDDKNKFTPTFIDHQFNSKTA